jgi:hypothetical protein
MKQTGGEELLQSKWPQINEDIAIRKKLSKMPLSKEHTVLNANRKTRLRKQNGDSWEGKKETFVRIETL